MGAILIVAELQNGTIREASYELASFAHKIAGDRPVKSIVLGQGVSALAEEFAAKGGGDVCLVDNDTVANYSADQVQVLLFTSCRFPGQVHKADQLRR